MATKRTTFLKRQKELKRIEKATQKREDRMHRSIDKTEAPADPADIVFNIDTTDS